MLRPHSLLSLGNLFPESVFSLSWSLKKNPMRQRAFCFSIEEGFQGPSPPPASSPASGVPSSHLYVGYLYSPPMISPSVSTLLGWAAQMGQLIPPRLPCHWGENSNRKSFSPSLGSGGNKAPGVLAGAEGWVQKALPSLLLA